MTFHRAIGPIALLFAGISSIIGSGWLFGPLYAAEVAGPAAIISWCLGGILVTIISLTFAELGSAFPVAGGMIQYAEDSHGPLFSFTIGWMVWISSLAAAPVETVGIIQYAASYIPNIIVKINGAHVLTQKGMAIAALIMLVMCIINYHGAKFFSHSNLVIGMIKLIIPIATVVLLFFTHFKISNFTQTSSGGFLPYGWKGVVAALPLGGVIYSFIGANTILQLAGETKNPQRNIPLALLGSMLFCIFLYTFLQIVFIGSMPKNILAHGWQNINYVGDSGPFAGMMISLGLGWFAILIYADAFISPFGTALVFTMSTARVAYGLSKIGFLPKLFSKLSTKKVPLYAIVLNFTVGLFLLLPFPGWQKLATFIISCFMLSYIIGPISLLTLRQTHSQTPRPFLLPFATITSLVAFYICNLLIYWTGWNTVQKIMIVLCIGLVYFTLHQIYVYKSFSVIKYKRAWWLIPYFILLSLASMLGSFGGGLGYISFGMDFLVIALISIFIFYWTLPTRHKS